MPEEIYIVIKDTHKLDEDFAFPSTIPVYFI